MAITFTHETFDFTSPSTKEQFKSKELSTKQLKDLVKSSIDTNVISGSLFWASVSDVIVTNCCKTAKQEWNILDRLAYVLCLRSFALGPVIEQKQQTYNTEDIYKQILLHVDAATAPLSRTISFDKYTVECALPTLQLDDTVSKIYEATVESTQNAEGLRKALGDAFVAEISKYVSSVSDGEETVDFAKIDVKTRIRMVEDFPAKLTNEIVRFAEDYKTFTTTTIGAENLNIDGSIFLAKK